MKPAPYSQRDRETLWGAAGKGSARREERREQKHVILTFELSGDMQGNESLAHYNAEYDQIGIQRAEHTMCIIIQSRPISPEFFSHF